MTADTTPASQEYTPSTSEVEAGWIARQAQLDRESGNVVVARVYAAEFRRWIKAHDTEVARKALTDAADEEFTEPYPEDVFAPLSESDNIDINSTLADYDVPGRDRISADMFRRAGPACKCHSLAPQFDTEPLSTPPSTEYTYDASKPAGRRTAHE